MPRSTTAKKAAATPPPADPLADLREDDDARYPEDGQEGPQEGPAAPGEGDPLRTVLGEALGAASMCWDPAPEGVFQPEQASAILDDLVGAIAQAQPVQAMTADEAVTRWHANTVAVGFLHKGGRCGCRYLAQVILGA